MDANRLKKVKLYSSVASTTILSLSTANADIIYADINPDSITTGNDSATNEYFFIDLDNNGTNDFQLGMFNAQMGTTRTYTWNGVWASGINTSTMATGQNEIAYSGVSNGYNMAQAFSNGTSIDAGLSFNGYDILGIVSYWSTTGGSNGGNGSFGNFADLGDKYLGLQFYIAGNIHYGWARVSVNNSNLGYVLKDYAFQDCPNFPIKAGATSGKSYLTSSINISGCDSASILGNTYYNSTIIYDTTNVGANCDSVEIYNLTINYSPSYSQSLVNCDSVVYNGNTYNNSITIRDTIVGGTSSGCDSIIITNITVNNKSNFIQDLTSCDSVVYNGNSYLSSITLMDTLVGGASNGCDSIVTTNIIVNNKASFTQDYVSCDSLIYNGNVYNNSTTLIDTITAGAANSCDSIITTNIIVNESKSITETATIIEGDSVFLAGANQTTSGTYIDSLTTSEGCDSIITTTLTVNPDGFSKNNKLDIKISPNPSNGNYFLDLSMLKSNTLDYIITDNLGRIIKSEFSINANKFSNIDLTGNDKGVYFLRITSENNSAIIKLIKN